MKHTTFGVLSAWLALGCGTMPAADAPVGDASTAPPDAGTPMDDAGAAPPIGDAGPGPGVDVAVYYFRGVYFVPERSDVSTYPVFESTWTQRGQRVGLFYNLPRMLVGDSVGVAMAGTLDPARPNQVTLSGPLGTAVCDLDSTGLPRSCLETFTGIAVDLERVRREAERDDPGRVEERVAVAVRFRDDPIGVLESEEGLLGPIERPACSRPQDCDGTRCDIDGLEGYCEPPSEGRLEGQPCQLDYQCADGLECGTDRRCEVR